MSSAASRLRPMTSRVSRLSRNSGISIASVASWIEAAVKVDDVEFLELEGLDDERIELEIMRLLPNTGESRPSFSKNVAVSAEITGKTDMMVTVGVELALCKYIV